MKDYNLTDDSRLQPAIEWFAERGWEPFAFQRDVWLAYLNGESGLIHAPTGTGKTYAVWMGPLLAYLTQNNKPPRYDIPLRVLWITPLRALASDTSQSLMAPIREMAIPMWTVETRTGDTSSKVRSRQRRRLPTTLVTTPESLSILLARKNAPELFKHLQMVVLDEWHELMSSKRGVQTELGLARLRRWRPELRVWGLSATMGNLDEAMRTLLGAVDIHTGEIPTGRLIRGHISKQITVDSLIPETMERFPWAGHLGLKLLPQVLEGIEQAKSSLVFTNTRNQTENWYQAILNARPDWAGLIALHHGALDREVREWVEEALKAGELKAVVCTSSLDLGVDFTPVERVFQVGSPKGVARLLQRAGRSGHQPGVESRATCVPTHAFELVEVAAVRASALRGEVEARPPIRNALDVLVQHLVTAALGGGFDSDALFREVRTTHAYQTLSQAEWDWALDFVTRGGKALNAYDQYHRVVQGEDGRFIVSDKRIAQTHRMSIGTITGDSTLQVRYLNGKKLGRVEETFISRLNKGDKFTLAGRILEYQHTRDMTAYVRRATSKKGVVPRWVGGTLPLSDELTNGIRQRLDEARAGQYNEPEMQAVRPILELQAQWSLIPGSDELLIERIKTRDGHHLFFYPFEGRLVHEGLAALVAYRLSQRTPITFTIASNDYGFELLAAEPAPIEEALNDGLLHPDDLIDDIFASINSSEMAKRQFRKIARVSGLVYPNFPGGRRTAKQLQTSASLIYDVLEKYEQDNLLLWQARQEVLDRQFEQTRLHRTLQSISEGSLRLVAPPKPTPFAFPLLVDRWRATISSEKLTDRIERLQLSLERAAT